MKKLLMAGPKSLFQWAKTVHALVPDSWRYGKAYRDALALFEESDGWDGPTLVRYQERLLRYLINHCYTNVEYYRRMFQEAGLSPDQVVTIADLRKIPYLTKEIVRNNKASLRAQNMSPLKIEMEQTGGSSGAPLMFWMDLATRAMERALVRRQLLWLGWEKGDVVAEIKSDFMVDPRKVYRYSPVSKVLRFGSFAIDNEKLNRIVQALQEFRPAFIKTFPSSLHVLSHWMERNDKSISPPKYIMTSSEKLYPSIKDHAERIFKTPVVDHYGQDEQVACAFQCSAREGYHIQMEQSIIELIPERDGEWEIVGTSLHNFAMPFVRYRTGDVAIKVEAPCSCGRKHPLLAEIKGRHGDILITPEGSMLSLVAVAEAFDDVETIKEAQVIQEDINTLRIKAVPWDTISESDKELLLRNLKRRLRSSRMAVLFEEVDHIPRTHRGKKPFVVSHINVNDYL